MNLKYECPKVSIIIPVYNGSNYLSEAIDSALAQSYNNLEVIVVNDGSKDDGKTELIALSYGERLRYFSKNNGGVASALNLGIKVMEGEYFSWLSHDDVYYPDKVRRQIDILSDHSSLDTIIFSDFDMIDKDSKLIGAIDVVVNHPDIMQYELTVGYPIHGCTLLIPKICFDRIGLFDERKRTTQDYDMWFRMADAFSFVHLPEKLIQSRAHESQGTNTMRDLHLREVNDLLCSFVLKLTDNQVTVATGQPSSLAFVSIAENFWMRKFRRANRKAWLRGVSEIGRTGFKCKIEVVRRVFVLICKDIFRTFITLKSE